MDKPKFGVIINTSGGKSRIIYILAASLSYAIRKSANIPRENNEYIADVYRVK